ncbi:hypothetical protein SAMN02982919_00782 [Giesbergeria anulus]|uniref:Uncharacterized protein n=1 Tax=Giesbergeria anulus TaxID=180197 RepID=A0A1H9GD15_9BURK|nr:hypothetical protein SAMN02982919_00782 [Giesbergeria anulus]
MADNRVLESELNSELRLNATMLGAATIMRTAAMDSVTINSISVNPAWDFLQYFMANKVEDWWFFESRYNF